MACINSILPIILYLLGITLLVILIILSIKAYNTLKKVDATIDDLNDKMSTVNNLFEIADRFTDGLSIVNDKIVSYIVGIVTNLFSNKKKEKSDENE
ncbi:MAG: hypothetical protein ACK5HP_01025 [Bacilli bacterium]